MVTWPLVVLALHSSTSGCAENEMENRVSKVLRYICRLTQAIVDRGGPSGVCGVVFWTGEAGRGSQCV